MRLGISLQPSLLGDLHPWHAVVTSRLGRTPLAHHVELATLYRWVQQTVDAGAAPLTVMSTAADRWVIRACHLLGTEPVRLELAPGDSGGNPVQRSGVHPITLGDAKVTRDEVAIMLADRVDVAMVRRGGTIHRLLLQRLAQDNLASVRVLVPVEPWGQPVSPGSSRVIQELIDAGAVGYCCHWDAPDPKRSADIVPVPTNEHDSSPKRTTSCDIAAQRLLSDSRSWLVHCTRARQAAWPGQSDEQFFDWLLLSAPQAADLSPLVTLQRIVAQQQLIGTGRTTRCGRPVVCFSDKPILEVVAQRIFRPHLGRWDAEPFGIAIRKDVAKRLGALPVIYFAPQRRSAKSTGLSTTANDDQAWRLQSVGTTFDWTTEREWRLPTALDLRQLSPDDAIVFVASDDQCDKVANSKWPIVSIESLQRTSRGTVAT
jgi:hypothetical protein